MRLQDYAFKAGIPYVVVYLALVANDSRMHLCSTWEDVCHYKKSFEYK